MSSEDRCAACRHRRAEHDATDGACNAFGCACMAMLEELSTEEAMGLDEAPEFGVRELYLGDDRP